MSDDSFYTLSGTVTDLSERVAKTRYGNKAVYGAVVSGTEVEFGFKKDDKVPYPSKGDAVSYQVKYEYGKYKVYGPAAGDAPAPVRASKSTGASASGTAETPRRDSFRPFPVPVAHGDTSIIRQNSLGHAVELVSNLMTTDDEPSVIKRAADLAIEIAYKFAAFSSGNLDADELKKITDGLPK